MFENLFNKVKDQKIFSELSQQDKDIFKKAKSLIAQSKTREQLKTARNYVDLFVKHTAADKDKQHIRDELIHLWLKKDKSLFIQ